MIILGLGGLMPVNRILAQRAVDLFQDYSWEQASLQAAGMYLFYRRPVSGLFVIGEKRVEPGRGGRLLQ